MTLWKWVIMPKYVVKRNGWDIADPSPRSLGIWRGIAENKNLFNTNIYFRIESGERILFYHDTWIGGNPLASQFSELFLCVKDRQAKVSCYMDRVGSQIQWRMAVRRRHL